VDQEHALRRGIAEAIGAGTLTFFGAGAVLATQLSGDSSLLIIALANGLAIGLAVTWLGHISGGHFNPAITFGFLVTRRIDFPMAVVYWVSQLSGAVLAALALRVIYDDNVVNALNLGAPAVGHGVAVWEAFVAEIIMTFFLVLSVFATAVDERGAFKIVAGFAIGLTITLDVLVGGPISGAAMNPSRAFGPQLVGNFWADGWIYYLAPPIGAAIAALLYEHVYLRGHAVETAGSPATGLDEPGLHDATDRLP
jgi:MIP family channel proteins